MKKWAWAFAAAAVVAIGCGGGGSSHGSTSSSSSGSSGATGPTVNLGTGPGVVTFEYLTGAGRAVGDPTAVIKHVSLTDASSGSVFESVIAPERDLLLNGYTIQSANLNIPNVSVQNSLLFDQYLLEIDSMKIDNGSGGFSTILGQNGDPLVSAAFPGNIRVFRGRQSNVTIRLDDTMFAIAGGIVTFDPSAFSAANQFPESGSTVNSYLGDYLMFDLSNLSTTLPQLPLSLGTGTRVYFTGDNYAVSTTTPGEFDVLTPVGFVEGSFTNPIHSGPITTPGTFTLKQKDPRDSDPNTALRITALQGIWRSVSEVVSNMGAFTALSLPSSADNNIQTILLIDGPPTAITNMYFGQVDLTAGTIQAFPINQVSPGSADNEIDGTVSGLVDVSGNSTTDPTLVRKGNFTLFNGTGTVPSDFPTSGTFIVFRR